MMVFDRILNKAIAITNIENPISLGRYIFNSDAPNTRLNGNKVKKYDFLVPYKGYEGELKIAKENINLKFIDNTLLNEDVSSLIKHSILDVSEEFKTINNLNNLDSLNILIRNFDERLEITEFEEYLQKKLFHIEEVCRQPSYHLKRQITKVNVSRAKRVPVKAINYLAAHTEDWSRRKIRTIEPRRILSEIIEDDLEIYENQVTASFIDKLLKHFNSRMINEIDIIDDFIKKIEEIIESRNNSTESQFWYKKLNRDYKKLGKVVDSIKNSRIKIEEIKYFISNIKKRLHALLQTDLYINNKRPKITIHQKLKRTNLFDNHQHYRFIKILWEKHYKKETIDYSLNTENNQKLVNSYINYSWVLIIRALNQIGFTTNTTTNNPEIFFTKETILNITIQLVKNKIINLVFNDDKELSFIPIPITKNTETLYPKKKKEHFIFL
ncbi:hypothetical protein PG910_08845 [Tenacibaculum dicentrarchi]|nr:hypothetical protein PG910_08845 [Tenacibaculum dicentrarchi]